MLPRWSLGLALSLLIHVVAVGTIVGVAIWRNISFGPPVDVEIAGMSLDDIRDLPLGPPPGGAEPRPGDTPPRARSRGPKEPADGELATREGTEPERPGADAETAAGGSPRPSDLRQYGPEGSRVTALVRLDRLRKTPYGPGVDAILSHLPDRRDLLDGTGIDLYDSFDALLIATPNPLDYTVTFLAARHHLSDGDLRAALERGAKATGRLISWKTEFRRPVAERRAKTVVPGATRDNRLIVMPAPGLVVVTPPVYRTMLLRPARPRTAPPDAGADGDGAGGVIAQPARTDGPPADGEGWKALLRRIDAEDSIMPTNAIAMVKAIDIFSARSLQRGLRSVPNVKQLSSGVREDGPSQATVFGMTVPIVITFVLGADPAPFADVTAEFKNEAQAMQWEREWPALRSKLRVNPYLVLTGFSSLVNRIDLSREGSIVKLHDTATELETQRLLQLIARVMGG
ncbi:MAG TPA: hypothetical protein VFH73_27885 [Polyangia bacterium]|jgi:hypothetical protein|nr:hypothetical protein [Polyangia bacterium]